MDYFKIADITVEVEWEDKAGKNLFYSILDVAFNPPFFGAYVLTKEEVSKESPADLHVHMRKSGSCQIPPEHITVANQLYYKENGNFCLTIIRNGNQEEPVMTIKTAKEYHRVEMIPHTEQYNVYSLQLLEVVFQQLVPQKNGFMIHGSGIEYKGEGIIFSGFSGSGKTTQARLWRTYRNTIVINGDCPVVRSIEDTVYMYGTPWCGTSGESINRRVPLKAIVLVNQAKENAVEEITGDAAALAVYTNILYFSQDAEDLDRLLEILPRIISRIKVYRLYCNMEENAVDTLEAALYQAAAL